MPKNQRYRTSHSLLSTSESPNEQPGNAHIKLTQKIRIHLEENQFNVPFPSRRQ
jgi:hypothetical protein